MTALAADRDTLEKQSPFSMEHAFVGTDSTQYYKGGIVCVLNSTGKLVKGATAATHVAIGRCEENYLTGTSNTRTIRCKSGIFKFGNSASADLIATTEIGTTCYIVDDQTVAKTSNSSARSKAGIVYDVDSDGVWVAMNFPGSLTA